MVEPEQPARLIIAAARACAAKRIERLKQMAAKLDSSDAQCSKVANSQNSSQQPDNSLLAKTQQSEK